MTSSLEDLADYFLILTEQKRLKPELRQISKSLTSEEIISIFTNLDMRKIQKILKNDLRIFLEQNKIFLKSHETNLLFENLDSKNRGYINFEDFLEILECKKNIEFNASHTAQFDQKINDFMVEFLKDNLKEGKNEKKILSKISEEIDATKAFKDLDSLEKGYIDVRDIYDFMTNFIEDFTYTKATKVMERLIKNKSKTKIYPHELEQIFARNLTKNSTKKENIFRSKKIIFDNFEKNENYQVNNNNQERILRIKNNTSSATFGLMQSGNPRSEESFNTNFELVTPVKQPQKYKGTPMNKIIDESPEESLAPLQSLNLNLNKVLKGSTSNGEKIFTTARMKEVMMEKYRKEMSEQIYFESKEFKETERKTPREFIPVSISTKKGMPEVRKNLNFQSEHVEEKFKKLDHESIEIVNDDEDMKENQKFRSRNTSLKNIHEVQITDRGEISRQEGNEIRKKSPGVVFSRRSSQNSNKKKKKRFNDIFDSRRRTEVYNRVTRNSAEKIEKEYQKENACSRDNSKKREEINVQDFEKKSGNQTINLRNSQNRRNSHHGVGGKKREMRQSLAVNKGNTNYFQPLNHHRRRYTAHNVYYRPMRSRSAQRPPEDTVKKQEEKIVKRTIFSPGGRKKKEVVAERMEGGETVVTEKYYNQENTREVRSKRNSARHKIEKNLPPKPAEKPKMNSHNPLARFSRKSRALNGSKSPNSNFGSNSRFKQQNANPVRQRTYTTEEIGLLSYISPRTVNYTPRRNFSRTAPDDNFLKKMNVEEKDCFSLGGEADCSISKILLLLRNVEKNKIELFNRWDFALNDMVELLDDEKKGYISLENLKKLFDSVELKKLKNEEIELFIEFLGDEDTPGLTYNQFKGFVSSDKTYLKEVQIRKKFKIQNFLDFSRKSKNLMKSLFGYFFKFLKEKENIRKNFEENKGLFTSIDRRQKGFITFYEIEEYLKKNEIKFCVTDLKLLNYGFRVKDQGVVTYQEFFGVDETK